MPVRKSAIALPQVQADPNLVKIINEWVPVAKPESARYAHIFSGLATVDNGSSAAGAKARPGRRGGGSRTGA